MTMQQHFPDTPPALRELAPASARLCLGVERFLCSLTPVPPGTSLLLGVSGGADSTALLTILLALTPRLRCRLHVVHLDHQLRPESPLEAAHVRRLCAGWQIPCHCRTASVHELATGWKTGLEDAARRARYMIFEQERQAAGAEWICTAHHSGDLEEDILLRLIRGAGWPALGGMPAIDSRRHLLRPLLMTGPEDLRQLLRGAAIPWVEDTSNQSPDFRRNRLRHDVLPLLKKENPAFTDGMLQLRELAGIDAAHWEAVLAAALERHPPEIQYAEDVPVCPSAGRAPRSVSLPRELLRDLDQAGRLRLFHRVLKLFPSAQARAHTLLALDLAWRENRGGLVFQFPGNLSASLRQGTVIFEGPPAARGRRPGASGGKGLRPLTPLGD